MKHSRNLRLKRRKRLADLIRVARHAPTEGDFIEVGVFRGLSARLLYGLSQHRKQRLFLYDTFEGHPYPFQRRKVPYDGIGAHVPSAETVAELFIDMPNANIIKGEFPDSAVPMQLIAFAHIDVDSFQSTNNTIAFLKPLMRQGGIMYFDDYGKHLGTRMAVHNFFDPREIAKVKRVRKYFVVFGEETKIKAKEWRIK